MISSTDRRLRSLRRIFRVELKYSLFPVLVCMRASIKYLVVPFCLLISQLSFAQQFLELKKLRGSLDPTPYVISNVSYAPDPLRSIGVKVKGVNKTAHSLYFADPEKQLASLFVSPDDGERLVLKVGHYRSTDVPSAPSFVAFTSMHISFLKEREGTYELIHEFVASAVKSGANSADRHEQNLVKCLKQALSSLHSRVRQPGVAVDESWLYKRMDRTSETFPIQQRGDLPNGAIYSHQDLLMTTVDTTFTFDLRPLPAYPTDHWLGSSLPRRKWPTFLVHDNMLYMMVGNRYARIHEEAGQLFVYIVPPSDPGPQGAGMGITFGAIGYGAVQSASPYGAKPMRYRIDLQTGELGKTTPLSYDTQESVQLYVVHSGRSTKTVSVQIDDIGAKDLLPGKHLRSEISTERANTQLRFLIDGKEVGTVIVQIAGSIHEVVEIKYDRKGNFSADVVDTQRKLRLLEDINSTNRIRFGM